MVNMSNPVAVTLAHHVPKFSGVDGPISGCYCGVDIPLGASWADHVAGLVSADAQVADALSRVVTQLRLRGEVRAAEIVRAGLVDMIRGVTVVDDYGRC